tara:strand:- start:409 stop:570 length:162 start_codon:yes stop_codon:yes gene_type:complete
MDIKLIDNVCFEDAGVDMFLFSGDYNGIEMTGNQLDEINSDFENLVYLYYKFR